MVVDDRCGWIPEGEVLCNVCSAGVVEVDSVVAVGWFRNVRVGLVVLTVGCAVVVVMKDNRLEIVEDMVNVVVFVKLWIGGLVSNSPSI